MRIEQIENKVIDNDPNADIDLLRLAYDFASNAHGKQKRKSGEPYIQHSLHTFIKIITIIIMASICTNTISEYIADLSKTRTMSIKLTHLLSCQISFKYCYRFCGNFVRGVWCSINNARAISPPRQSPYRYWAISL